MSNIIAKLRFNVDVFKNDTVVIIMKVFAQLTKKILHAQRLILINIQKLFLNRAFSLN